MGERQLGSLGALRARYGDELPSHGGQEYPCGTGKAATAWCNNEDVRAALHMKKVVIPLYMIASAGEKAFDMGEMVNRAGLPDDVSRIAGQQFMPLDTETLFGSCIEAYVFQGNNCGFAKFGSEKSAQQAINVLDGKKVLGCNLKVMVAEPEGYGGGSNKRARTE